MLAVQAELSAPALLDAVDARRARGDAAAGPARCSSPAHVNGDGGLVNALSSSLGRRRRKKLRRILGEDATPDDFAGVDFEAWRDRAARARRGRGDAPRRHAAAHRARRAGRGDATPLGRSRQRSARSARRSRPSPRRARSCSASSTTGWRACDERAARPRGRDRRYPRLTLRVEVELEAPGRTATPRPPRRSGAGGLFVATPTPLRRHAPLVVRFHLPGDDSGAVSATPTSPGAGPAASGGAGHGPRVRRCRRARRRWPRAWSAGRSSARAAIRCERRL